MGYYTAFNLKVNGENADDRQKVVEALRKLDVIDYALDEHLEMYDIAKWYDYFDDMVSVSKEFPHIHFILHGEGEENGDIWDHHFINGKSVRYNAEIIIPPFDEKDLR